MSISFIFALISMEYSLIYLAINSKETQSVFIFPKQNLHSLHFSHF